MPRPRSDWELAEPLRRSGCRTAVAALRNPRLKRSSLTAGARPIGSMLGLDREEAQARDIPAIRIPFAGVSSHLGESPVLARMVNEFVYRPPRVPDVEPS